MTGFRGGRFRVGSRGAERCRRFEPYERVFGRISEDSSLQIRLRRFLSGSEGKLRTLSPQEKAVAKLALRGTGQPPPSKLSQLISGGGNFSFSPGVRGNRAGFSRGFARWLRVAESYSGSGLGTAEAVHRLHYEDARRRFDEGNFIAAAYILAEISSERPSNVKIEDRIRALEFLAETYRIIVLSNEADAIINIEANNIGAARRAWQRVNEIAYLQKKSVSRLQVLYDKLGNKTKYEEYKRRLRNLNRDLRTFSGNDGKFSKELRELIRDRREFILGEWLDIDFSYRLMRNFKLASSLIERARHNTTENELLRESDGILVDFISESEAIQRQLNRECHNIFRMRLFERLGDAYTKRLKIAKELNQDREDRSLYKKAVQSYKMSAEIYEKILDRPARVTTTGQGSERAIKSLIDETATAANNLRYYLSLIGIYVKVASLAGSADDINSYNYAITGISKALGSLGVLSIELGTQLRVESGLIINANGQGTNGLGALNRILEMLLFPKGVE